jgi:predicted acetyltransferase
MAAAVDIAPLDGDRVDDAVALSELVFHEKGSDAEVERRRRLLRGARAFGAFDGGSLVGCAAAYAIELSIPGGALPCAGVAFVGVSPTHRRRGVLTALFERLLPDAVGAGQLLAALWAAEAAIYGRYGFGAATRAVDFELRADRPLAFRIEPDDRPLRFLDWRQAPDVLGPIHARWRVRRPGMPARTPEWWRDQALRPDGAADQDSRLGPLRIAVLDEAGYAAYRSSEGHVEVVELVGDTPAVEAALWRWLASIDLVDRVAAPSRPVDEPLPRMLAEGGDAAPSRELYDALWLRLLDVPAALRARAWAADVDVVLDVADARLPVNAGTWRLTAGPGVGEARCERTSGAADVRLDVRELGAAYLGGVPLAALAAAGLVDERTPGALDGLDAALRVPLAPYCADHF